MRQSGVTVSSGKDKNGSLIELINFKLSPGKNCGEVNLQFRRVRKALTYNCGYTPTPFADDKWELVPTSTSRFVLKGLKSGVEYDILIGMVGAKGQLACSTPLPY